MPETSFDVAIVGAGIIGLAHALAAARLGKRVVVIDRDAQANGASIRNFGFVTVTGQERGLTWRRARRTRDIWAEVAAQAGIAIEQRGLMLVAQRPEALNVIHAFAETEMAEGCMILSAADMRARFPLHGAGTVAGALWSPHDLRVESRTAIPRLAKWLEERWGVTFRRQTMVRDIAAPAIVTSNGTLRADFIVVCPGDDFTGLYADRIAARGLTRCRLQMLRLADPGMRLPGALMSDLSLVRYLGYAALPEAASLRALIEAEQPDHLANGIHLIVVQSADGSLVVGDSHHYAETPGPFASEEVDRLILQEYAALLGQAPPVLERWTGTYASGPDQSFVDAPDPAVRLVMVTSGSGASTGFAIAEDVIGKFYDVDQEVAA
ncbi:TIGR03364 family FAD-dependent oxidoreductase [Sphingomonas alpina]|uniref:TIGR03364 family FAD-dependent oxidoreductase n=1 Tax=Sphingomonas alpina TaxID=653931 RepID=A0A7H0LL05_9SPHN|nr:TIGR03364 family FAD-dependent oxidoreductase [Sphingomonas alpina]QNQ10358.1 TIGR03364 family FAD-dependent oxidoreductase [Sphingomonas alpina]